MPRPPVPLSASLSRTIVKAKEFLEEIGPFPNCYGEGSEPDEVIRILNDFDDQMSAFSHSLIAALPEEEYTRIVIDVKLTLELRLAIAQAADCHRVLWALREVAQDIATLVRKEVESDPTRDSDDWEPYTNGITEARCEVKKFLTFALFHDS